MEQSFAAVANARVSFVDGYYSLALKPTSKRSSFCSSEGRMTVVMSGEGAADTLAEP